MPARRKRRLFKKKSRDKKPVRKVIILIFLAVLLMFGFMNFRGGFWDGDSKLSIVINKNDGDVQVATFDPTLGEITSILIPGDTQVNVARQLGERRLKNVWELGKDEGLNGQLLVETITRHFKFPVFAWADLPSEGFSKQGLAEIAKALFSSYLTNLTFGDRIKVAMFNLKVKNIDRVEIDLKDTAYLRATRLIDGEEGYVVTGRVPQRLASIFAEPIISEKQLTVAIENSSGNRILAEDLGGIVEVLGVKVAAIKSKESESFDCKILGDDEEAIRKISEIFSCSYEGVVTEGSFDLVLQIGEEFLKRF